MKKTNIGSAYYLALGLIIFPIGTLLLLRQPTFINLMSNLMPDIATIEIFGLILQFLGEGLICFGIIGTISSRVLAATEYNRQILAAGITKNIQEQTFVMAGLKRNFEEQIATLQSEIGQFRAHKGSFGNQAALPSNCRFCGSPIMESRFCPRCGKAN